MPLEVRDVGGHITLITIDNQSKRNAMSRAMLAELAALWDRLDTSGVRCVVVTGAGEKGFCAGADIGGDLSADETAAVSSCCWRPTSGGLLNMPASGCRRCAMRSIPSAARR